jgi:hypothetical protein
VARLGKRGVVWRQRGKAREAPRFSKSSVTVSFSSFWPHEEAILL